MTDVTDNFNRANGALGANWTSSPELATAGSGSLQINSNAPESTPGNNFFASYYSASSFDNDQNAQITILATYGSGKGAGAVVRHTGTAHSNCYFFFVNIGSSGNAWYFRCDAGSFTTLGTAAFAATVNGGSLIKLRVAGSTLTASVDGVDQSTRSDATYASGYPGVICYSAPADDFVGGPVAAAGSVGASSGAATVAGVGAGTAAAVAAASGAATVAGVAAGTVAATASASGAATVTGVSPLTGTVTDDFNRSHADLGPNWVESYKQIDIDTFPAGGAPNVAVGFTPANAWYCGRAFDSDHSSQIDKVTSDSGASGPTVRNQQRKLGCYYFGDSDAPLIGIYRQDQITYTLLGASSATHYGAGHTLKLAASGSTLTASADGTTVFTRTDATYTGGAPGLGVSSLGARMDNWVGAPDTGPGLYVQDAFSYVPGTALQSWWTATKGDPWVVGNRQSVCAAPSGSGDGTIVWNANTFAADHSAEIILYNSAIEAGATIRNSLVANNNYMHYRDGSTGAGFYRTDAGSYTALDSPLAPGSAPVVDDATVIGLTASGSTITGWLDAIARGPVSDATYTGGAPGAQAGSGGSVENFVGWPTTTIMAAVGAASGLATVNGVAPGGAPEELPVHVGGAGGGGRSLRGLSGVRLVRGRKIKPKLKPEDRDIWDPGPITLPPTASDEEEEYEIALLMKILGS